MKKIFLIIIVLSGFISAQSFIVKEIKGIVKVQVGVSEKWQTVKVNGKLDNKTTLMTTKNSIVVLQRGQKKIKISNASIVSLKGIKKLTTDDLLLALAMENLINIPNKKNKTKKSSNTAVYGAEINGKTETVINDNNFGVMRLNGAKQLAENGYVESAIIEAMETYRKYPNTKLMGNYRIYFADLLSKKRLYDEALTEYNKINGLQLSETEKIHAAEQMTFLKKKLLK